MRRSTKGSKDSPSEKAIEHEILNYLATQEDVFCFKVNNVGVFDEAIKAYRKPNSPFLIKGVSDILGLIEGRFLAIEVKRSESAKRSPEQEAFVNKINREGGFACFAWSLKEVQDLLSLARLKIKQEKLGTHGETVA